MCSYHTVPGLPLRFWGYRAGPSLSPLPWQGVVPGLAFFSRVGCDGSDESIKDINKKGFYYTHSGHTVPSLLASDAPAEKLVKAFKRIHHAFHTPALVTIIASSSSFACAAYYLYHYPPKHAGVAATATFASASFFPSTSVDRPLGDEWALYGASALLVVLIVPYTKALMSTAQKRLLAAAESAETAEQRKLGVRVVEEEEKRVREDFEEWKWRSTVRAGLAGAATAIAVFGLVAQ